MNIFVFGSNLQGIHGKGAALNAVTNHGAVYGQGVGRQGKSYAIPTKLTPYKSLPLRTIEGYVGKFIKYARENPDLTFHVTAIGCGLAGFHPCQIAPLFKDVPENCLLPGAFKDVLEALSKKTS